MTLVVAFVALLIAALRLRARPSTKLAGYMMEIADFCPEFDDEEIWSMGFASRAEFRVAEIRHFEESAHEDRGVSELEWRQYHGLPLHQPTPKIRGPRTRPAMRQRSRSRRAPRRARASRRARPASRTSGDPAPPPWCPARRDLLHEGGAP